MSTDTLRQPNPLPESKDPASESAASGGTDEETPSPKSKGGTSWPAVLFGLALVLGALMMGLGLWWTLQPPKFDVDANAQAMIAGSAEEGPAGDGERRGAEQPRAQPVAGATTVATAIRVAETLLDKPGGYLHNDIMPPGVLMDNMPNWEYGALTELRDTVRALRNDFSRSQTQSIENEDLKQADSQFNFDVDAWILPASEEQYRQGVAALRSYLHALVAGDDQTARFYARADNLSAYLAVVEKRLGSYGQRLTASVGDAELTAALNTGGGAAAQTLEATAWDEIDNVFYEARGYTWALLHMMKALLVDFRDVLQDKNAEISKQQIIRDLELASMRKWSPIVLNGHGYGALANHSLVLASYVARANAAVLDLRMLLQRG
jgi:hypothetical protein